MHVDLGVLIFLAVRMQPYVRNLIYAALCSLTMQPYLCSLTYAALLMQPHYAALLMQSYSCMRTFADLLVQPTLATLPYPTSRLTLS